MRVMYRWEGVYITGPLRGTPLPLMTSTILCPETVPLGEGPPTKEELLVYYPAKFTWEQLKTFVNSGYVWVSHHLMMSQVSIVRDLGLLKRDKKLQKRYEHWAEGIKEQHGSMGNRVFAEFLCLL
jgi:hypothetical protein